MNCYGWGMIRNSSGDIIKMWVYDYWGNSRIIFDVMKKENK